MTEYQPGRVYSGVVDGKRRLLFCGEDDQTEFSWVNDHGMLRFSPKNGIPTDVRGPLVVLDHEFHDRLERENCLSLLRNFHATTWIADQIEAQTTPPLQVGWHECVNTVDRLSRRSYWWDGDEFRYSSGGAAHAGADWRSVAYLGKGTCV